MDVAVEKQEQPGRLLLVENDEATLRAMQAVLRRGLWEIATASSAETALERLKQFQPDVVISDFRMPGMNGVDLLARVKEASPHSQRILLTGQEDHVGFEEVINRSEVFRLITKPWNDGQLLLTVKSAFEQHGLWAENDRLLRLTQEQNLKLRHLNADLEQRVILRSNLVIRAKREWELTFDTIDHPLAVVQTGDFLLRRANRAYARAAQKPITDVGNRRPCYEYLFNRDSPCLACPLKEGIPEGAIGRAELRHQDRVYLLNVYPMLEEKTAVCSYRDVTEERGMNRRLLEAEKMIAVGNLAGGVAHEINNPLGGILAFAQLMKRDEGRTESDLESLSLIEESALRCKRIVESLLKFSRRSRDDERRMFDLSKCVEDAALLFRAQLKRFPRAQLELNLKANLPSVHGDAAQLGQVVLNLLQNGLHALPSSEGTLKVETGKRDSHCFFRVTDTGSGIREEHLAHIFEPHFTTKPPGEGTGLGLSIAYRIVEDHGGQFEVATEVGKGSTFTVLIPVQPGGLI